MLVGERIDPVWAINYMVTLIKRLVRQVGLGHRGSEIHAKELGHELMEPTEEYQAEE